jgi:hypothetical protein
MIAAADEEEQDDRHLAVREPALTIDFDSARPTFFNCDPSFAYAVLRPSMEGSTRGSDFLEFIGTRGKLWDAAAAIVIRHLEDIRAVELVRDHHFDNTPFGRGLRFDLTAVMSDLIVLLGEQTGILDPRITQDGVLSAITNSNGNPLFTDECDISPLGGIITAGAPYMSGIRGTGWTRNSFSDLNLLLYPQDAPPVVTISGTVREPKYSIRAPQYTTNITFGSSVFSMDNCVFNLPDTVRSQVWREQLIDTLNKQLLFSTNGTDKFGFVNTGRLKRRIVDIYLSNSRGDLLNMVTRDLVGLLVSIYSQARRYTSEGSRPAIRINGQQGDNTTANIRTIIAMWCSLTYHAEPSELRLAGWFRTMFEAVRVGDIDEYQRQHADTRRGPLDVNLGVQVHQLKHFLYSLVAFYVAVTELSDVVYMHQLPAEKADSISARIDSMPETSRRAYETKITTRARKFADRILDEYSSTETMRVCRDIAKALALHERLSATDD